VSQEEKMLNQISPISSEANSSGIFLKNYIDYVEDFPGEKIFINIIVH
jgi:hypothetical protein